MHLHVVVAASTSENLLPTISSLTHMGRISSLIVITLKLDFIQNPNANTKLTTKTWLVNDQNEVSQRPKRGSLTIKM
jgi:hypothetical protein